MAKPSLVSSFVVFVCNLYTVTAADGALRGVPKLQQSLYSGEAFACLVGGHSIPIDQVNDEYCDCVDGSDEPGTSACNGKFYCENTGHRGLYIYSSRVNDGVCDCCDGSDEWWSSACANTCEAAAAVTRAAAAEEEFARVEGARIKAEYIERGKKLRDEENAALLEAEAEELEGKEAVERAREAVAAAEVLEAQEREARDVDQRGALVERLGLSSLSREQLEDLLIRLARETARGPQLLEMVQDVMGVEPNSEEGGDEARDEGAVTADATAADGDTPAKVVPPVDPLAPPPLYVHAEAEAARAELTKLEAQLRTVSRRVQDSRKAGDGHDYGPHGEFHVMKLSCLKMTYQKYNYEACPFGKAKQDGTSLGTWKGWEDNYRVMKFEGGQSCWKGPKRSATVHLSCGAEDALISVDEPSTCTYLMHATSPAACDLHPPADNSATASGVGGEVPSEHNLMFLMG